MKKHNQILFFIMINMFVFFSGKTWSFGCNGTFSYTVNAFQVTRNAGVEVSFPASFIYCAGSSPQQDALRIQSVTLNQKLIDAGFTDSTLTISSLGTYPYPFSTALYRCVWYDSSCTVVNGSGNTSTFTPKLKRSGPGKDLSIANGETLLTIILYQRSNGAWGWPQTIVYKLNGTITPPTYTCSVDYYDAKVQMPSTHASDIRLRSPGKIPSSKKSVDFQLSCQPETVMSLQFDGTKMSDTGTDNVLVNQVAGNGNIGVQLFYNDVPVTFGHKFEVTNNAELKEDLNVDAYLYYKGGAVTPGLLRSLTTFTFSYQ